MLEPFLGRQVGNAAAIVHALAGEDFGPKAEVLHIRFIRCVKIIEVDDIECIREPSNHDPAAIWANGHAQSFPFQRQVRCHRRARVPIPNSSRSVETGSHDPAAVWRESGRQDLVAMLECRAYEPARLPVPDAGAAVPTGGQQMASVGVEVRIENPIRMLDRLGHGLAGCVIPDACGSYRMPR